eukprot:jgi/Bigna1/86260/estExt_fgenesh1_pg.C_90139
MNGLLCGGRSSPWWATASPVDSRADSSFHLFDRAGRGGVSGCWRKRQLTVVAVLAAAGLFFLSLLLAATILVPSSTSPPLAISSPIASIRGPGSRLPPELAGKDLGPTNKDVFVSALLTWGSKMVVGIFKGVETSLKTKVSEKISKFTFPRLEKFFLSPKTHKPELSRLRMLIATLEEGIVALRHGHYSYGENGSSAASTSCCFSRQRRSALFYSNGPEATYVRMTPDGEAIVWCPEKHREKLNLELGAQPTFIPSKKFQYIRLENIMFILKGQETDGFQRTGAPGRDHLCLSIVSKQNELLELQFTSEEMRDLWAEALRDSLWARARCLKEGLLNDRIPPQKGLFSKRLKFLRSKRYRPVMLCGGLAACALPLPARWAAVVACYAASR